MSSVIARHRTEIRHIGRQPVRSGPAAAPLMGSVSVIAMMVALTAMPAQGQSVWNAGTGNWSVGTNWTPNGAPNSAGTSASITNGGTANVDGGFSVGGLTIGNTSGVGLNNNTFLNINGGVANAGVLSVNSGGNFTDLILGASAAFTGGGTVNLSNSTANRIYAGAAATVLTNTDNKIAGAGEIGINGNLVTLINASQGIIDANQTSALTIDGGVGITNNGIVRATNTGGLKIFSGNVIDGTGGGAIQANGAGAHIDLQSGTLKGGTLSTSGGGVIQTTAVGTLDGSAGAVTIAAGGGIQVNNNTVLNLLGTITNKGSIALNSVGNFTDLISGAGTVTLNGGGSVVLSNTPANRIYSTSAGAVLNNVDNTISGAGELGVTGALTIQNQALIDANATNILTIDSSNPVKNTGTLRSSNTTGGNGGLRLLNTTIDNTGSSNAGLITAIGANTHVDLQNATIKGGTITTSGGGLVQSIGSGTLDGSAAAVTISTGSTVQLNNNTSLSLIGSINAQGAINLNSVGNFTDLIVAAGSTVTLTGSGGITASNNPNNRIYGAGAGSILDNVNSTISGGGEIGVTGNLTLKNESLVDANGTTALTIDAPIPVQNTGTIRSSNTSAGNGGLHLLSTTIDNTGSSNSGLITAIGANTHVDLQNATIKGGTITTSGGGLVQSLSTGTLDGSTAAVTISSGSTVQLNNNTSLNLVGTINAQGVINLNSVGNFTDLIIAGGSTVKLTGPGGITASNFGTNRIYGSAAGAILDNVNSVIGGGGEIGVNANLTLKNEALVDANGTAALTVDSPNAVLNTGTMRSSNTSAGNGGLVLRSTIDNTGLSNSGLILANGANTHVDIVGSAVILGGTLTSSNGGVINVLNTTLDGSGSGAPITISAGSTVHLANNQSVVLNGVFNNLGTLSSNSVGNFTDLVIAAGGATLGGGGTVALSDNPNNRIYANAPGTVLTNAGNTISGAGVIFTNGGLSLVNTGTVNATGANALTLRLDIANNPGGVLRGGGAGGLVVNAGATTNTGVVEALDGSGVTFNGSASIANNTGGTLTGGTWRAVSTGGGATVSLVGGAITTNAATLVLDGAGSKIQAGTAGSYTDIQSSLTSITAAGQLNVLNSQNFTTANDMANGGQINLGGGTFTSRTLTNSGTTAGFGTVTPSNGSQIANNGGSIVAKGGVLTLSTGAAGNAASTLQANNGATLDLSAAASGSTTGTLTQNGALKLGANTVTVSTDYTNAAFGTGNSFNAHAGVTGTGKINAAGSGLALTLTGSGLSGAGTPGATLALGNVHVGSGNGGAFAINWAGTGAPVLRGAVQTTSGLNVSGPGFGPISPGGSTAETVSVAAGPAGALSGQSLTVVSNFDNVAAQTVKVTGAAYDLAQPTTAPSTVAFGNVHRGDVVAQKAVTIGNQTLTNAAFQEGLNASFGAAGAGTTNNGGAILNLAAGSTDAATLKVGILTGTAGAINASTPINLTSNGSISSLANTTLTAGSVTVTGAVYNFATSSAIAPVHIVAHVGDGGGSVAQALSITNTAQSGSFSEGLNSSFGAYTNTAGASGLTPTLSGAITNLAAGAIDSSSMRVTFSTTQAGTFGGSAAVNQASNGLGTSGLGISNLGSQDVGIQGSVTGGVFTLATPTVNTAQPVDLGNWRINSAAATQALSISNTSPSATTTEALNGSVGTVPAGFTATGAFSGLAAGAPANTAITVGLNTTSAGAKSGNVTLNFVSDGTAVQGDGSTTSLTPATPVQVKGNVYALAASTLTSPSAVTLAARVGDAAPTAAITFANAPGPLTENLKVSLGTATGGFATTGSAQTLAAGGVSSGLGLQLSTGTAGTFSGQVAANLASSGVLGELGAASDVALTGGLVTAAGRIYQTASASVGATTVDFGIVHVLQTVASKTVGVSNIATGALVDSITGSITASGSPFTASGNLGANGVASLGSSNALSVGLNTRTAGVFSGTANLVLSSHDADLADKGLTTGPIGVTATVNNYAVSAFTKNGGTGVFGGGGTNYTLDFGQLVQGGASITAALAALNAAAGPADLLDGGFSHTGSGFGLSGFNPFTNLAAGAQIPGLGVSFNPSSLGLFSETIDLSGIGHNAGGYSASIADTFLTITANVVSSGGGGPVPEPSSLLSFLTGAMGLGHLIRRRRRAA